MKTITDIKIKVTLELSEEEALWLCNLVQNRLVKDESERDEKMRCAFFNALKDLRKK